MKNTRKTDLLAKWGAVLLQTDTPKEGRKAMIIQSQEKPLELHDTRGPRKTR